MNSEQFKRFLTTIKNHQSKHIQHNKTELDEKTGNIKIEFVQMPRGVIITIDDRFDITPELEAEQIIQKADIAIKSMAVEDTICWITESKKPDDFNGIQLVLEGSIPDNMIIMNHATFLTFMRVVEGV